ncbi:hypothetical protein FQN60_017905 [Etheostoma spectabile]|uniref:Uncharacterized protein n=1 Tax=Etheostoma spectabile TaxID=54343 RepID=A0A5J5DGV3_9PERO|nr:hypothetical protein FQN60_017905 [Etheostoma spectabile]
MQNMFRTGFLVRATHTLLTWVITLILFLHNTDLRKCEERGELLLPVLFFLLVVLSVLLYFAVSLMDPGFVLTDSVKGSNEEMESMIPQSSTPRLRRYCPGLFRSGVSPSPTWVLWFRVNAFLLVVLVLVGVFSVVAGMLLGIHLYLVSINCTTWEFMSRHRIAYLKNCGDEENPFDRGVFCNLWDFFCICRTVVWEKTYDRNTPNSV